MFFFTSLDLYLVCMKMFEYLFCFFLEVWMRFFEKGSALPPPWNLFYILQLIPRFDQYSPNKLFFILPSKDDILYLKRNLHKHNFRLFRSLIRLKDQIYGRTETREKKESSGYRTLMGLLLRRIQLKPNLELQLNE